MLKLYQILTILLASLIRVYLFGRKLCGKEDPIRFNERLGISETRRPDGKLIWLHGASVGEAISILPLTNFLAEKYKNTNFLITTGTVTSAKLLAINLPLRTIHQYVPVDILHYVQRFLKHWKPDLAIFVESEIWPNLITQTSKNCPLIMVNGHISSQSFKKWHRNKNFAHEVFSSFSLCLMQSQIGADQLCALGARNAKYSGNIKYDAPNLPTDDHKLAEMIAQTANRRLWVAASTHREGGVYEEKIVATAHKELKTLYPDLLTIIIPRHPSRKDEILAEMADMNLKIAVRSNGNKIDSTTDIYLADTLGELGIFYRLARIVFVGGSLVKRGGHNPLEPARLGCAIVVGCYTFNFIAIMREFEEKNAIIIVKNSNDLISVIQMLFEDEEKTSRLINAALEIVGSKRGVIAKVVEEISPYIENTYAT